MRLTADAARALRPGALDAADAGSGFAGPGALEARTVAGAAAISVTEAV